MEARLPRRSSGSGCKGSGGEDRSGPIVRLARPCCRGAAGESTEQLRAVDAAAEPMQGRGGADQPALGLARRCLRGRGTRINASTRGGREPSHPRESVRGPVPSEDREGFQVIAGRDACFLGHGREVLRPKRGWRRERRGSGCVPRTENVISSARPISFASSSPRSMSSTRSTKSFVRVLSRPSHGKVRHGSSPRTAEASGSRAPPASQARRIQASCLRRVARARR